MPFFVALVARDRYLDANAKLSASRSASFIAGPAVGGVLVQLFTAPGAILVDALTFFASALQIGRVPVEERPVAEANGQSLMRRARDGLAVVMRDPYLRAGLGCATTINFFTFMAQALLILFASRSSASPRCDRPGPRRRRGGRPRWRCRGPAARRPLRRRPMVAAGAVLFPAPLALLGLAGGRPGGPLRYSRPSSSSPDSASCSSTST